MMVFVIITITKIILSHKIRKGKKFYFQTEKDTVKTLLYTVYGKDIDFSKIPPP